MPREAGDAQVRLAMGLAHFRLEAFPAAVKMWRMAVDLTPLAEAAARMAIMRNIGVAHLRMQQHQVVAALRSALHLSNISSIARKSSMSACPAGKIHRSHPPTNQL